ncbi:class I SAM-dependent methyltransferase [Acinetobacter cumulans]|uniref:Class I SAM-dependent methyltransferase n=1 Tax=Acinetobacter cumulans TaxID=2136182 RepID=A0A3A8G8D8_9GAMM|nr:class I SAM-dependent methyltransferase [Acinetobacter cumulans]RKG54849.1 class I SAM-dependent methyltransferase [Acinetobacter cumulans]
MIYKFYQQHIFPHLLNQVMQVPSLMDKRRELLLPIQGEVLEIGFGTGLNLAFYQAVDTVYALEPNIEIYQLAAQRIHETPFEVQHIQASAEKLPFADRSLDHIVCTWTLCSIADVELALDEVYRVLKVGGTFHVVEHVLHNESHNIQRLQNLFTPLQKLVADGCHLNRNIEQALKNADLEITELQYFDAEGIPSIGRRMLLARAVKSL